MAKRKTRVRHAEIVRQFAARLLELRQAKGMTQAELARQGHVALSHLSKLENGEAAPGLDLLDRLARALGTTVAGLLPQPAAETAGHREHIRKLFDSLLPTAGEGTLTMLELLLTRLADSPTAIR